MSEVVNKRKNAVKKNPKNSPKNISKKSRLNVGSFLAFFWHIYGKKQASFPVHITI